MSSSLRVLLVDDSEEDAILLARSFRETAYAATLTRVDDATALEHALHAENWDVVLCDFSMPGFGAAPALRLIRKTKPNLPVLIVSGAIGEEAAVEAMKLGAFDYLLKDQLARLGTAVDQALQTARLRRERNEARELLEQSEREQRALAQALQTEKSRLVAAQAVAKVGSWELELRNGVLALSDETCRIFGIESRDSQLTKDNLLQRVHPADRASVEETIARALENRTPCAIEHRLVLPDGQIRWLALRWQIFSDAEGRASHALGTCQDISERIMLEEEMRLLNQRMSLANEAASIGTWDWEVKDDRWFASDTYATMLGYAPTLAHDRNFWLERVHPDDRQLVEQKIRAVLAGSPDGYEYEARMRHADGSYRWIHVVGRVLECDETGKARRLVGVRMDITQRKNAEETLRRSEASLAKAQRIAKIGNWELEIATSKLTWSDEVHEIFGIAKNEFAGTREAFLARVHPDDLSAAQEAQRAALANNTRLDFEHRIVLPNGTIKTVHELGDQESDAPARTGRLSGTVHDITERRQHEDKLRTSEAAHRKLAEQLTREKSRLVAAQAVAQVGSWETDLATGAVEWSEETFRIFERDPAHYTPTHDSFLQMVHPHDRNAVSEAFAASLSARGTQTIEHRVLLRDGRIKVVEERWQVLCGEDNEPQRAVGTCQDITQRTEREGKLKVADAQLHSLVARLNTVREEEAKRIARELHDELGQYLTLLKIELDQLQTSSPTDNSEHQAHIVRMHTAVDHTIRTVQTISADLRLGQLDLLGLASAINWQLGEFARHFSMITKVIRLDEVNLSEQRSTAMFRILQEALTNVVRHARATEVEVSLTTEEAHAVLAVGDNGRGITAAELADPQAIGLLGMHERAELVGGTTTVARGRNGGTSITVRMPLTVGTGNSR